MKSGINLQIWLTWKCHIKPKLSQIMLKLLRFYTYIIGHYNPSVRITANKPKQYLLDQGDFVGLKVLCIA